MTDRKIILVTGATGNQGGAAARRLLADGWQVRALTRQPSGHAARQLAAAGAEIAHGDLGDRASLDAAVIGVHGVFSVQRSALGTPPTPPEDEIRQGRLVADAAAAAGVEHLIYSSVAGADRAGAVRAFASKREIERHIASIGIPATILRPVSFMDNYADPGFGLQIGVLATPLAPDVPEQLIAVDDIGTFVALAFAKPECYLGETITIAADELRPPQTAQTLTRALGREIPYQQIPIEAIRLQNEDAAQAAAFLNDNGGYGADISAARALHPGLMTFDDWLATSGSAKLAALAGS
jgi:uncharacterized protein YbjT (DUF2867 family)